MDFSKIKPRAPVVGADDLPVGVVDFVQGRRLMLARPADAIGRQHAVDIGLIAAVEDGVVRLSADAAAAILFED